jgi:hypothetical protein
MDAMTSIKDLNINQIGTILGGIREINESGMGGKERLTEIIRLLEKSGLVERKRP